MKFLKDNHADMKLIGGVIGLFVTLIISILVLYSIAGSLDTSTIDAGVGDTISGAGDGIGNEAYNQTPAENTTSAILDQAGTFYTIAPIIGIVVVAVVILSYVSRIGGA